MYRIGLAVGFSFDGESFGKLAKKLSGIGIDFLDKIGLQLEIGVAFSPPQLEKVIVDSQTNFAKEPLKTMVVAAVEQGLFIGAQLSLPKDCGGNKFCEITKKIVGPDIKFYLSGLIEWKKVKITAGFRNIHFAFGLYFDRVELYVEASWNSTKKSIKLGFRVDIKIPVNGEIYRDGILAPSNDLFLFGVLEYDFSEQQVAGKLGMRGMWRKAYFIPFLSFGNVFLGVTYKIGAPVPITGVQFGSRVEFGYDCLIPADFNVDGHCFGGAAYFGVGKPSFFYAEVTALTLGKVFRMMGVNVKLPRPIHETGFTKTCMVSYATEDVDLRIAGGPFIFEGFLLEGKVNIFGWEILAKIKVSDNHILADLKPDPIVLGIVITIVRSPSELSLGPWFYIELRKNPIFFKAYIEGYIDLFSIKTYCRLNLTMEAFELLIKGNFMGLIKAEVFVAANYPMFGLAGIKFYVKVEVDLYSLNKLIDNVVAAIRGVFDKAKEELGKARRAVIEKREECKRKMQLKCENCKKIKCAQAQRNCKGFLDAAGKWIGGVVNAAGKWIKNTFKKIGKALAPVGNFFKKVFSGWRRKRELQHVRNELFEVHIRRRRFISKFICEGVVGGTCKVVSKLCQGTCQAINFIAKGLCHVLDIAVGFLKITELACGWVSKAIHFLSKIFRIYYIKFEFGLATYASGGLKDLIFNAAVDMMIFGHRFYAGVQFNLRSPLTSLKAAGNSATNWYKDKMNPAKGRTDTEKNYYDNANPFVDFELSEQFQIENQQSAQDDRRGACMYVDSKSKGSLVKVTACSEKDERQYFAYTLKGQIMSSYTKLCLDTNGAESGKKLKQTDCKPASDNQNFQCDLVVRTVKRRRANMCLTAGKTGLTGPGSLTHVGSRKCIHVSGGGYGSFTDGTRLIIHSGCHEKRLEFEIKDGYLTHTASGKCARPVGSIVDGVQLGLYSSCTGHKFSFTKLGSLQHIGSKKCVNPASGKMQPPDSDHLILNSKCENTESSVTKEHLLFAFIPTDGYIRLDKCCDFGNPRLDQRWEIMDEEIATICSKFTKNLAKNKQTSQSSVAYNGFPQRAVDENYNNNYDAKSCTHTRKESNPWWRVDLGQEYIITDVLLVNRYNKFERLTNVEVRVGKNINQLNNPTCHDRIRTVGQGQAVKLQCNPPIPGRYVAVQMFGDGILTLCEVSVYSRIGVLADLCQLDNGGCAQICYNKCDMKVECACGNGWTLAYDRKSCIDKNECQVNNGGCDIYHGVCINTPGSYHCRCNNGYQLKENSQVECEDFNECNLNNAGCEHICNNSKGSYNCDCRKGYRLKTDKYGCEDVNECLTGNGGCQHTCQNYEGGYYCECNAGYRLMDDDHHCEEIYCPALEAPFRGSISPSMCVDDRANIQKNTVCTYKCVTGHNLVGGMSQICQIDGVWRGATPYCKPVLCSKRPKLLHGGTIPAAATIKDVEYGQRVVYYCSDGYELTGPRYTTCQADKTWTETASVECVKVNRKPWISCPTDVLVNLPPNQAAYVLGFKWDLPQSNMKNVTVTPDYLNDQYPFPAGKTRVTWTATNENGDLKTCYYHVTVNDITAPVASICPSDKSIQTDNRWQKVTWTEPVFTDNVGIINTVSNKRPGEEFERFMSLRVRYVAMDAASNKGYCEFTVTVYPKRCVTPPHPKNGVAQRFGLFLQLKCHQGFFFNPLPAVVKGFHFVTFICRQNKWLKGSQELTFVPDCVGYTNPAADLSCPTGAIYHPVVKVCLNCPPGTFFNDTSKKCQDCMIGSYQDEDGKTECQVCSLDKSTKALKSKSINECIPKCHPGFYSDNGLHEVPNSPCVACPRNTYNPFYSQTSCQFCPVGSHTSSNGSASIDHCLIPVAITQIVPSGIVVLTEGQDLVLDCLIKGRPAPTVTWAKILGVAPNPNRVKLRKLMDGNVLVGLQYHLSLIQSGADSGTYECRAENRGRTRVVTKPVSVVVNKRPQTVTPTPITHAAG